MNKIRAAWPLFLVLAWALSACSSESKKKFTPFAGDTVARDLDSLQNFSVILYDMDVTEDGQHRHRYKIVVPKDAGTSEPQVLAENSSSGMDIGAEADSASFKPIDELKNEVAESRLTDWMPVTAEQFEAYSNDMGMEIITKKDGEMSKIPSPPGYTHYVGNPKYGQWQQNPSSGESFWSFYGKYMMMQQVFGLLSAPRMGYYNDYNNNYRGRSPYYGPAGQSLYGTNSRHAGSLNPGFSQRMQSDNKFKQRVNNMVQRSQSNPKAGERYRSNSTAGRSSLGTAQKSGSTVQSGQRSTGSNSRTTTSSDAKKSSSSWSSGSRSSSSSSSRSSSSSSSRRSSGGRRR